MKRKNSAKNLAHSVLPPLTEEQKAQIASLSALPDEQIDYADAPATGEEKWQTAVQGRFYKPMKVSKTIESMRMYWLASAAGKELSETPERRVA